MFVRRPDRDERQLARVRPSQLDDAHGREVSGDWP